MAENTFLYSEARMAEAMQIARGELRFLRTRDLVQGKDWKKDGHEILLTKRAVATLAKNFLKPLESIALKDCLPQKKTSDDGLTNNSTTTTREMVITKVPVNPRMVLARFPDEEEVFLAEVGRNATFAIGDMIQVQPEQIAPGVYQSISPIPRNLRRPAGPLVL